MLDGILLSEDLIFISRVTGIAGQLGLTVQSVRTIEGLLQHTEKGEGEEAPGGVLLDLHHPLLEIGQLLQHLQHYPNRPFVLGYGSHVEVELLRSAREAGCDLVLPRSKFVEELPQHLPRWLRRTRE